MNLPLGIALAQEGNRFYAFVTNSGDSTITRVLWETSLVNTPVYTRLNIAGILTGKISGIQVKNDNGNWFGFVTNGSSVVRLDFGPSLANLSPAVSTIVSSDFMNITNGLVITKDGVDWIGFCTNWPAKTIVRFFWGNSLQNIPLLLNLGNVGGLTRPMQPAVIRDASGWYMFVSNTTSLCKLQFGNSLMNIPSGQNLGQLNWITDNRGISTFTQCFQSFVLVSNHDAVTNQLFQIHYPDGLSGPESLIPLGNLGSLFETLALSETVTVGDTVFCLALNAFPSLSVICFTSCDNSVIPVSTQFDPSPVIFPDSGIYTIKLIIDSGMPTEQKACKEIEFISSSVYLGGDTSLCEGHPLILDAGSGYVHYQWSTGDTTRTISASNAGSYSVIATNYLGCELSDTIEIAIKPEKAAFVDTSICFGQMYYAGGGLQSVSGTYSDTLSTSLGCDSVVTTHLTIKNEIYNNIGNDTCLEKGKTRVLTANVPGADSYTWQDGSHDSAFTVTAPGSYWVMATVDQCHKTDTVLIDACLPKPVIIVPNAFSPNGDGVNDIFKPVISDITDFSMVIYNRWGEMVFETYDIQQGWDGTIKGKPGEPEIYNYIMVYGNSLLPEQQYKLTGTVMLIK